MPSPFPGMDPYLEETVIWRDFHKSLAVGISGDLNQTLPDGYYDGGPYRRGAVDYSRPPAPPLSPEDAAWAEALLRDRG